MPPPEVVPEATDTVQEMVLIESVLPFGTFGQAPAQALDEH